MTSSFSNAVVLDSEYPNFALNDITTDRAMLASQLDREADAQLQHGRHTEAERLAHLAASLRAGGVA